MIKIITASLVALALSACGTAPPTSAVKVCRDFAKVKISTPASFEHIDTLTWNEGEADNERHIVIIEFDAENQYGARVRSSDICHFDVKNGRVMQSEIEAMNEIIEHLRILRIEEETQISVPYGKLKQRVQRRMEASQV